MDGRWSARSATQAQPVVTSVVWKPQTLVESASDEVDEKDSVSLVSSLALPPVAQTMSLHTEKNRTAPKEAVVDTTL